MSKKMCAQRGYKKGFLKNMKRAHCLDPESNSFPVYFFVNTPFFIKILQGDLQAWGKKSVLKVA